MSKAGAKPGMKEIDVSEQAIMSDASGVTLLRKSYLDVIKKLPLPGIVIFVHGVNSDGEWYDQTEEGLCKGLNNRLKRNDDQMVYPSALAGQLTPARYKAELTADGYLDPDRQPDNFIETSDHFSPVIRFRWGYKANSEELQKYGTGIYLNEHNYWGGGPFANGCTSLPDLWNEGVSQNMLLWWEIGHFNPMSDRPVFSCPPRPYFVLAALRLAKLIESIRKVHANTPITIVCHSQGNMVAIAAAFLGDRMPEVSDSKGVSARCVADTYVLCNPPYSLQTAQFVENWTETHMKDCDGGTGRQTADARMQTMKNFFDIIRKPASSQPQEAEEIDKAMTNRNHQFDTATDRQKHGYGSPQRTCGRVTLYCNPHDQVISAKTIRGIGWLGMCDAEIAATNGHGVFCQRVFAQDFTVGGTDKEYGYWTNHYRAVKEESDDFWMPRSPTITYTLGSHTNNSFFGEVITYLTAPLMIVLTKVSGSPVNAVPPKGWKIPLTAPTLPQAFKPQGPQRGGRSTPFDQGRKAPGEDRDAGRAREPGDTYGGERKLEQRKGEPERPATDAGTGDAKSEAQLRYEHHARLRMEARQKGFVKKDEKSVTAEDEPATASEEYKEWRSGRIRDYLDKGVDNNATDHSTIMTDPENAEKALAYDVAVGVCDLSPQEIRTLRIKADWQLNIGEEIDDPDRALAKYILTGKINEAFLNVWAATDEACMPMKIIDRREYRPSMERGKL